MQLQPSDDEARAALYNSACCYTKQKRWQPAVDAVVSAVNDYDLKLSVAVKARYKPAAYAAMYGWALGSCQQGIDFQIGLAVHSV